jgi:predicted alpha/beta-hydrolase family hydrolase
VEVPTLVVQGENDPMGRPAVAHRREVVVLAGDHGLKADVEGVRRAIAEWLDRVLRPLEA